MNKKVLVLPGDSYKAVGEMFASYGYDVLYDIGSLSQSDLVVFTGGSDVSPYIYGEEPAGARGCDPIRDEVERDIYLLCEKKLKPMVGICRGGQLLNVLNGGEMAQDHGSISGDTDAVFYNSCHVTTVRVDHHQGMYAGSGMDIFLTKPHLYYDPTVYAGFYPKTKSLCFQPHPEWGHKETEDYFFELLDNHIFTENSEKESD